MLPEFNGFICSFCLGEFPESLTNHGSTLYVSLNTNTKFFCVKGKFFLAELVLGKILIYTLEDWPWIFVIGR